MSVVRSQRHAAGVAALVAGVLAACGGGGGADDGATTTSVTIEAALVPFCDAFGALLVGPLAEGGFDTADPAQLGGAVGLTLAIVDELAAVAPPEVAVSAEALAADYRATFAVLERYGYDLARLDAEATPEDRAALDAFGASPSADGQVAFTELETFVSANCAPGSELPPELTVPVEPTTTTVVGPVAPDD